MKAWLRETVLLSLAALLLGGVVAIGGQLVERAGVALARLVIRWLWVI